MLKTNLDIRDKDIIYIKVNRNRFIDFVTVLSQTKRSVKSQISIFLFCLVDVNFLYLSKIVHKEEKIQDLFLSNAVTLYVHIYCLCV